jgi:hypothetical protein
VEPPKPTTVALELPGAEPDEDDEIRESDLLHHFKNNQVHPIHNPAPNGQNGAGASHPESSGAQQSKAAKTPPDVQLDRAIGILEHWSKYKVELAKADESPTATGINQ